jgi:hypothetical protein
VKRPHHDAQVPSSSQVDLPAIPDLGPLTRLKVVFPGLSLTVLTILMNQWEHVNTLTGAGPGVFAYLTYFLTDFSMGRSEGMS